MPLADTVSGGARQKASPTLSTDVVYDYKDPVKASGAVVFRSTVNALAPSPATFTVAACTWAANSTAVTTATANGFANVKPGDTMEGTNAADFTGQYVISVDTTTYQSLVLSANPDGIASGIPSTLTFTPIAHDATDLIITLERSVNSAFIQSNTVKIWAFDGTLSDADRDGDDEALTSDPSATLLKSFSFDVNLDQFYRNKRVARG